MLADNFRKETIYKITLDFIVNFLKNTSHSGVVPRNPDMRDIINIKKCSKSSKYDIENVCGVF